MILMAIETIKKKDNEGNLDWDWEEKVRWHILYRLI